jgi:hypothetical protein
MNEGKERFREEFLALTNPNADKELDQELNSMGGLKEVEQASERQQADDFMRETQHQDEEALGGRDQAMRDTRLFLSAMSAVYDITKKCGVADHRPVGMLLNDLESEEEAGMLAERADVSSEFFKKPQVVRSFVAGIRDLIKRGVISPNMSFFQIIGALEGKCHENEGVIERADELERRDAGRQQLKQLMDVCAFIDGAPRGVIQKLRAERIKRTPDEDTLKMTIRCDDSKLRFLFEALVEIPRNTILRRGDDIVFEAPFPKNFLDEAQRSFSWIK